MNKPPNRKGKKACKNEFLKILIDYLLMEDEEERRFRNLYEYGR